jgi:hypothetical protein
MVQNHFWGLQGARPGKRLQKTMERSKDPPFFMGKLTISMAMFNSYVKLPEGIAICLFFYVFVKTVIALWVGHCLWADVRLLLTAMTERHQCNSAEGFSSSQVCPTCS